jgi:alkylhydroperoxidase/carboxymuconolactone decarboxylase family protein YurZ
MQETRELASSAVEGGWAQVLERLAAGDEEWLRTVLAPTPGTRLASVLDRRTRALVQLSALLVMDAPTCSLGWAAETAATRGVDDRVIVHVLHIAASVAGIAATASGAERLALAMGLDSGGA